MRTSGPEGETGMPSEMAIPGTHAFVMDVINRHIRPAAGSRILDIGAGNGALSEKLKNQGLSVSACDLTPGPIDVPGVAYRQCDDTGRLPFDDGRFDIAVAVEVIEHIDGHHVFFSEAARILKPGGTFLFTTPNILSMKSRVKFLLNGYYYSFGPLTPFTRDPASQHIAPFTLNRYAWMLSQHGLPLKQITIDKVQTTSVFLSVLFPLPWFTGWFQSRKHQTAQRHNTRDLLLGRTLAMIAQKTPSQGVSDR